MAKFTASAPLNIRWFGNEISGAAGATHRIPDALAGEFEDAFGTKIPGFSWVSQDESSAYLSSPIAQTDVTGLTASLADKYDKAGGTISGAVTATGALIAQTSISTPSLTATNVLVKDSVEVNGGFTNPYDTDLFIAAANRSAPGNLAQSIYAILRVSGSMSSQVMDAAAFEIRVSGISNASFLNAIEATGTVVGGGGAHSIADIRAITANLRVESAPTGTVTSAKVITAQTVPSIGSLVITTLYGLYVEQQTVGATNWSVYAPGGNSLFGQIRVSQTTAAPADIQLHTAESLRWIIRKNTTAESGSNAGSDLEILARSDTGAAVGTVLTITRSNLAIRFGTGPLGFFNTTPVAKRTGWATATGTATRTTFATDSVTLIELARRVKALIDDLHSDAGYGLISA
jgi:hypothetical protein